MKKNYVIQNATNQEYWYGFYSNKKWTDNVLEAKLFDNKQEVEDWIDRNICEIETTVLIVIKVYMQ